MQAETELNKYIHLQGDSNMPILVLLHGFGANERDLIPIVQELGSLTGFDFESFSVRAPIDLSSSFGMPAGFGGFGWFEEPIVEDFEKLNCLAKLQAEEIIKFLNNFAKNRDVILLGFSQGAVVALASMQLYLQTLSKNTNDSKQVLNFKLKASVLLSGYLCDLGIENLKESDSKLPVFHSFGESDQIVLPKLSLEVKEFLAKFDCFDSKTVSYQGLTHSISLEELNDLADFLKTLML